MNKENNILENAELITAYTSKLKKQQREYENKFHNGSCEELDRPQSNFDEIIIKNGFIFELVEIIPNNSKSCKNAHNGATGVYKLFSGALGYDR